jgi:acetyltransferase-like isoleucine patch superfamily enzyme
MINLAPNHLGWFLRALPNFLWPLKWLVLHKSLKKVGKNFRFSPNSIFSDHRLIEIGNNVFFGEGIIINTVVPVKIGNNVMFGPEVMIMGGDHNFNAVGKSMRFVKQGGLNIPVILENDVWIGSRSIILKGVKIGEGTVIGAGSLLTKSLPPYSVSIGNPCKPLKCRFSSDNLKEHLQVVNSSYTFDAIAIQFQKWGIKIEQ